MITKNESNVISFILLNSDTGELIIEGPVSVYLTKDNEAPVDISSINTITHKGNGIWTIELTAENLNADQVGLLITHSSAVSEIINIHTVESSSSDGGTYQTPDFFASY